MFIKFICKVVRCRNIITIMKETIYLADKLITGLAYQSFIENILEVKSLSVGYFY